ncbi:UPF0147 family protein [Candidatus Woesearchaeota archaeon]|nr:UPF0147 family protein [Candidatus Woesearchaeota archaeon]
MNEFKDIINDLESIENDLSIPKNARLKIRKTIEILSTNEKNINLTIDRSLEELNEIADDANIPQYTKMQIWNIVSQLESR